jgi:GNAT superfamily N-acetyltransferase
MGSPGIVEIERAGLKAWPGIEVEWDGSWVRRASNGYTQRANSVQCFDPADDGNVVERIAASRRWFEDRGLKPIFRVNPLTAPALNAALDAAGWDAIDHSQVVAMELGPVGSDPRGEVLALHDPEFLAAQQRLSGNSDEKMAKLRAVLGVLEVPAIGIVLRAPDGRAVSSALMAIADGIVITGNVVTDQSERRQGYGGGMMRTGLAWAHAAGAKYAALNVVAENAVAQAFYRGLGYRHQYDYVYRVPGGLSAP